VNVFLTGASSGIGAALAREFSRRGAHLGLVARRADELRALAQELSGNCRIYALDVTDRERLLEAARDFEARCAGTDIVIANAGISTGVQTQYYEDLEAFDRVLATNLNAVATCFHPFIGAMRARGNGTLVAIASVAGVRGLPGSEAYCASKAALISYCESLRVGLRGSGVRVVTIAPLRPHSAHCRQSLPDALPHGRRPFRRPGSRRDPARRKLCRDPVADGMGR